jgi:4-oxalocrotonate tautomerase
VLATLVGGSEIQMPYVNIKVTREGTVPGSLSTTPEQKVALIKGVTDLLFNVMGKDPNTTFVVIDEVAMEDWGLGGLPVENYRRQKRIRGTDESR